MGINSAPLAVLSYFKVLNIVLEGSQQAAWINANLSKVESSAKADPSDGRLATAIRRLDELRKTKPNIGKYLYERGGVPWLMLGWRTQFIQTISKTETASLWICRS